MSETEAMSTLDQGAEILRELLALMGIDGDVEADETDEQLQLRVNSDDAELLIGKHGRTLDSLQYIVSRTLSRRVESFKPLQIDVDGYRERRVDSLVQMAKRLADEVLDTGKTIALSPMSPHDRRIVHMALRDYPDLATRSEGEEPERRLFISLRD